MFELELYFVLTVRDKMPNRDARGLSRRPC